MRRVYVREGKRDSSWGEKRKRVIWLLACMRNKWVGWWGSSTVESFFFASRFWADVVFDLACFDVAFGSELLSATGGLAAEVTCGLG